jgi:hypothetical protein
MLSIFMVGGPLPNLAAARSRIARRSPTCNAGTRMIPSPGRRCGQRQLGHELDCGIEAAADAGSDLLHISGIPGDKLIRRDQREAFDLGLGNQHAVKWVLVDRRQIQGSHCVLARDGELAPAIVDQAASQSARLNAKVLPAEPMLDGDFPKAHGAEP